MKARLEINENFAKLKDTLIYTLSIHNDNREIRDIYLISPLSTAIHLKNITIGGQVIAEEEGFGQSIYIPSIEPFEVKHIVFEGVLEHFPNENPITQLMDIYYQCEGEAYTKTTNAVMTYVGDAGLDESLGTIKIEADKKEVDVLEDIRYTIELYNRGNKEAQKLNINNIVPKGTRLVQESLVIEGASDLVLINEDRFYKEQLSVGEHIWISYSIQVLTIPDEAVINCNLQVKYDILLPNREEKHQKIDITPIKTSIFTAFFQNEEGYFQKSASQTVVTTGDYITYVLSGMNRGTTRAIKLFIKDKIPDGMRLVDGSIEIDGTKLEIGDIEAGIQIQDKEPGETFLVTYQVLVEQTLPLYEVFQSSSELVFLYKIGDNTKQCMEYSYAPKVYYGIAYLGGKEDQIIEGIKSIVTIGETIEGVIGLVNKGNREAEHVQIAIEMTQNISLQGENWYESEGIYYKSYQTIQTQNIWEEKIYFHITNLDYEMASIKVKVDYIYEVEVGRIESMEIMQEYGLYVQAAQLNTYPYPIQKYFEPQCIALEEESLCFIQVTNSGNVPAFNIKWEEILPEELEWIELVTPIEEGIILQPESSIMVGYKIKARYFCHTPLRTTTILSYDYLIGSNEVYHQDVFEEQNGISIKDALLYPVEGEQNVQQTNKTVLGIGDRVVISLLLGTRGNVTAFDIDIILPDIVGGIWHTPNTIKIPQIGVGESQEVRYELEVVDIPTTGYIGILPMINYYFTIEEYGIINRNYPIFPVELPVRSGRIEESKGLKRKASKQVVELQESSLIEIEIMNTGNIGISNIYLQEIWSDEVAALQDTLKINGQYMPVESIEQGVYIGELEPGEKRYIEYAISTKEIPADNHIWSKSYISYEYIVGEEVKREELLSSPIMIEVRDPDIRVHTTLQGEQGKSVQIDLNEVFFIETIVKVTGNETVHSLEYALEGEGIIFEPSMIEPIFYSSLEVGSNTIMRIKGKIQYFPVNQQFTIIGKIKYNFKKDGKLIQRVLYCEPIRVKVYTAGPLDERDWYVEGSHEVLHIGEKFIMRAFLSNRGNREMKHTVLNLQGLPLECFKLSKICINEESVQGTNISEGIGIGSILQGESKEIIIEGELICVTKENVWDYWINIAYKYYKDNSYEVKEIIKATQARHIFIRESGLSSIDSIRWNIDKKKLEIGEVCKCKLTLSNCGNATTRAIKITVKLPEQLQILEGYSQQFYKEELECDAFYEVDFQVKCIGLYPLKQVKLQAIILYSYEDALEKRRIAQREIETEYISIASVDFTPPHIQGKISKKEVALGDQFYCHIKCQNGGNLCAKNVYLQLIVPESIQILGNAFLQEGILEIGDIEAMQSKEVEVPLSVISLPKEQLQWIKCIIIYEDSGVAKRTEIPAIDIFIRGIIIDVKLNIEEDTYIVGEEATYQLEIVNRGNEVAYDISIIDHLLQEELQIEEKLLLQSMAPFSSQQIQRKAKILGVPTEKKEQVKLSYKGSKIREGYQELALSNPHPIVIEMPKIEIIRRYDKQILEKDSDITVYITIMNTGSMKLSQLMLYDTLPNGTVFIDGSFKKDNVRTTGIIVLEEGIDIGELNKNQKLQVSYSFRIDEYTNQTVKHQGYINYNYAKKRGQIGSGQYVIEDKQIKVKSPYKHSIQYEVQLVLGHYDRNLENIISVKVTPNLMDCEISKDGENKAIVKALLAYEVTYENGEEVYTSKHKKIHTEHITLYYMKQIELEKFEINVEKVYYTMIHKRALKVYVQLNIVEL